MLKDENCWTAVGRLAQEILSMKEADERATETAERAED